MTADAPLSLCSPLRAALGGVQLLCSGPFRCAQLCVREAKLSKELKEEEEMNRCLRANQNQLQTQLVEEKLRGKENGEERIYSWGEKQPHFCSTRLISFCAVGLASQNKVIFVPNRVIAQLRNPEEQGERG